MRAWPAVAWKPPAAPGGPRWWGASRKSGLLRERWAQVKDGLGQVVLLSGEAGIGKSRLVQVLTDQVAAEPQAWLTPCQCSPYYQHTALYPLIDLLERVVLALRAGGVAPAEAGQTGGLPGAVWPAPGGGGAPLCRPALPAAAGGLCAPDGVSRAAEAADPACPADDPACASPPSSPCSLSWKTCTGSIRPRWNCSASWSIKAPPPAFWRSSPFGPTSAHPGRAVRTSPR